MEIRRVRHRGLLRLLEENDSRELRPDLVKRLRNILAALIAATDMTEVSGPPGAFINSRGPGWHMEYFSRRKLAAYVRS